MRSAVSAPLAFVVKLRQTVSSDAWDEDSSDNRKRWLCRDCGRELAGEVFSSPLCRAQRVARFGRRGNVRRLSHILVFVTVTMTPAIGQTTHEVIVGAGGAVIFAPADIVIAVGDTVRWVWESASFPGHNVESGVSPVSNGYFNSGPPTNPPHTFEVVFDAAFLEANPEPGNVYPYFCGPHGGLGMVGSITVTVAFVAFIRGDANGDGVFNGLVDSLRVLEFQFQNGKAPPCLESADRETSRKAAIVL